MAVAALVGVKVGDSVLVGVGLGAGASAPQALRANRAKSSRANGASRLRRRVIVCRAGWCKITILEETEILFLVRVFWKSSRRL
jgi:hypothetical protein